MKPDRAPSAKKSLSSVSILGSILLVLLQRAVGFAEPAPPHPCPRDGVEPVEPSGASAETGSQKPFHLPERLEAVRPPAQAVTHVLYAHVLDRLTRVPQRRNHAVGLIHPYPHVAHAVHDEHGPLDLARVVNGRFLLHLLAVLRYARIADEIVPQRQVEPVRGKDSIRLARSVGPETDTPQANTSGVLVSALR